MSDAAIFEWGFGTAGFSFGLFIQFFCISSGIHDHEPEMYLGALFGLIFTCVGGFFLWKRIRRIVRLSKIRKKGKRYSGKIYGYVEDKTIEVNDRYPRNTKVRYFDEQGRLREAILPTNHTNNKKFPYGATIDIALLNNSYAWFRGSIRTDSIPNEDELLDVKPMDPAKMTMVAATCPNCGASFSAAKGFENRCPYCGGQI